MTTIGKDLPVRSDAFRFNSEKRASSAATSPARTECFDIFSPEPGESDVISQMERLSSKEIKIAARLVWMAVGASCRSATVGMIVSRVGVRNLTLSERWSLSTSPWDLSTPHDVQKLPMASHAKDGVRSCPRAGCGKSARPVVCPAKAGMFSRRKACRGKSQKPRSLDSRVAGNQDSEAYRQRLPREDDESPGRNDSERKSGLESA